MVEGTRTASLLGRIEIPAKRTVEGGDLEVTHRVPGATGNTKDYRRQRGSVSVLGTGTVTAQVAHAICRQDHHRWRLPRVPGVLGLETLIQGHPIWVSR